MRIPESVCARWFWLPLIPALWVWFLAPVARAEKPADDKVVAKATDKDLDTEPAQWLRFVEDGRGGGKLEAAIGTYKNDAGTTVHLVGAVHIGDRKYYQDLAKTFDTYDVLLYEMVKPKDAGAPAPGVRGGGGMVSMFQRFLKDALELDFQLDGIDYTKRNFVHADLDAETFAKLQEERGESILGLMLGQMMREMMRGMDGKGASQQVDLMDLIDAFDKPDRARQFKLILGRTFGEMEEQAAAMQGTVLLSERNKKALSVLKEQVRAGKKNIGLFYGAAHMPEIESRLALMGFKRTGLEWRTAWDMTDAAQPAK